MTDQIRRDIYSVKAPFDNGCSGNSLRWAHVGMYASRQSAKQHARDEYMERQMHGGPFPLLASKIVHPCQAVVDAYLTFGNTIRG